MALARPTPRQIALGAAYTAFYGTCFLLFCYWTFPYDRLGEWIVQEFEAPLGPDGRRHANGRQLEIIEVSPSWLTGVQLEGVHVTLPADAPDATPVDFVVDEVTLRVSLLALLVGDLGGSLAAELGDGSFEMAVNVGGGLSALGDPAAMAAAPKEIEIAIDELDLRPLGVVRSMLGVPLAGVVDGTVEVTMAEEVLDSTGAIDLTIAGLTIGDGAAKLALAGMGEGLTLEAIDLGDLTLDMSVEGGLAHVRRLAADGPDAKLEGSGDIRLASELSRSRIDLLLKVTFEEAYRNRSPRTRALFSLLDVQPQLRAARGPDGSLQFRVTGSPSRAIRYEPAGRAGGAGARGARAQRGGRARRSAPAAAAEAEAAPAPTPAPTPAEGEEE